MPVQGALSRWRARSVGLALVALAVSLALAHDKFFDLGDQRSALLASKAHRDAWFDATTPEELKTVWSEGEGGKTLLAKLKEIEKFETTVMVEVKLVGFTGEGYRKFVASEGELQVSIPQ